MKKKDKTPFVLKTVRWVFPKLEKIAPSMAHRYFIKIFFTPLRYPIPRKERDVLSTAEKLTVQAFGKKVQVYFWGPVSGPVVLLVHGWAGRAAQFRKFIPALSDAGYRVVGFDGPAHGRSEGRQTSILEFESALQEIFKRAGEPEALIAHSFGGVASLYAAMNGLKIKKLINIASPTIGDEIISTYLKTINGSASSGEAFKTYMMKTFNKSFDEFSALHIIKHLRQDVKLLLIHDEDDKEVTIRHPQELIKVYSKAQLFRTSGLGHTRILKDDAVIKKSLDFIQM